MLNPVCILGSSADQKDHCPGPASGESLKRRNRYLVLVLGKANDVLVLGWQRFKTGSQSRHRISLTAWQT